MNYVLIENGQITEGPKPLPKVWKNHSSFDKAPSSPKGRALLVSLGWYPVEIIPIGDYNRVTHYLAGESLDVQADKVVLTEFTKEYTRFQKETNLMNDWHSALSGMDEVFPRDLEDDIISYQAGVFSERSRGPRKKTHKQLFDERIALRAAKPPEPSPPVEGEEDWIAANP